MCLKTTKKMISIGYHLFVVLRARDGDRTTTYLENTDRKELSSTSNRYGRKNGLMQREDLQGAEGKGYLVGAGVPLYGAHAHEPPLPLPVRSCHPFTAGTCAACGD